MRRLNLHPVRGALLLTEASHWTEPNDARGYGYRTRIHRLLQPDRLRAILKTREKKK